MQKLVRHSNCSTTGKLVRRYRSPEARLPNLVSSDRRHRHSVAVFGLRSHQATARGHAHRLHALVCLAHLSVLRHVAVTGACRRRELATNATRQLDVAGRGYLFRSRGRSEFMESQVYWVDPPRQVSIAPIPDWSLFDIGLDKTEDGLVWLGYSNTFCQFARTGWFCAVTGLFLLALATVLTPVSTNFQNAGYGVALLGTLAFVFSTFALSGPFRANQHLESAAKEAGLRHYERSLEELENCVALFPVLSQDSNYISQRGLLESRLGLKSDYARLHQARDLESSGRYDQSFGIWNSLCKSEVAALRREALRAVLRFAVQDYNCNRVELARQRLQFVLSHQPGNVKVIHYLQIISIREENTHHAYQMCDWMHEVTEHLNFSTTKVLKYASQQNAKLAAAVTGDQGETWNRTVEAR